MMGRFNKESGSCFYNSFLRNMHGAFLYVLDNSGLILYVAGAAIRTRVDHETDEVIIMTPEDIMAGMIAGEMPEYRSVILKGPERRGQYKVVFRDVPFLSLTIGDKLWAHGPTSWAVMNVGPVSNHGWAGAAPFCANTEHHLDHRSWHLARELGAVNGQGGNDLSARLAPIAAEVAASVPSAMSALISGAGLYGGMPENLPDINVIRKSAVIQIMTDREIAQRRAKLNAQKERRKISQQVKYDTVTPKTPETPKPSQQGFNNLLNAIDPSVLEKMEQMTQADAGGSGVS